jgi:hypothetical protein
MRVRATELLGHPPGEDPPEELRALRTEPEGRDQIVAEIAELLHAEGIPVRHDVVTTARAFLAPPADPPTPARHASPLAAEGFEPDDPSARLPIPSNVVDPERSREVADLEEQRAALDRNLVDLEADLLRIDKANGSAPARIEGADLVRLLEGVIDSYERRELLAGRLPLVLDGVLDGLDAETREAAVKVFARAPEVQTVVVTDDPEVMQSLSRAGATLVRWPEQVVTMHDEAQLQTSPARGA